MPWNYLFLGPSQGVVWPESGLAIHPDWGLPKPRSGKDAMRTHAMEKDAHTQVYQDVAVLAQTPYRASVWVQSVDLHGKGFGTQAGDSAGLCVIEMDAAGKVLVEHPKVAVTKAGDYKELSQSFTTTPSIREGAVPAGYRHRLPLRPGACHLRRLRVAAGKIAGEHRLNLHFEDTDVPVIHGSLVTHGPAR